MSSRRRRAPTSFVASGRLPRGCRGRVCEALALTGPRRLGQLVALGKRRSALIVGKGSLRPDVLPDKSELGARALLVHSLARPLQPLVALDGSTVVYDAALDPGAVRGFELPALSERLRRTIVRLERGDPLVRASAPLGLIDGLAERGRVARGRLLLVAGQAAALVVAFAAFVASSRRRDRELVDDQLATLGGSRAQVWTARCVDALAPSLAGTTLALAGLWLAARVAAERRELSGGFVAAALPAETVLAIAAAGAVAFLLLLASVSATPLRRSRLGVGAVELAALTALTVVVWQAWTTGALDPDQVASGAGGPLLLVVPALGFFAAGVLLLRALPTALRLAARLTHGSPFGLRLAALTAARRPAEAAAATTFLAVALGSSLFSLDYRATLERQARDQAAFTAGAAWRVVERGRGNQPDVTPLTRFARLTAEPPTPVLRLDGSVSEAYLRNGQAAVRVLALAAARAVDLHGWRQGFSALSLAQVARRLRPRPVRLAGPSLARDGRALRVWARSKTQYPRVVVLHLLLPGQRFAHVRFGVAWRKWRLLRVSLPPSLRAGELVGVEFVATKVPTDFKYDPKGFLELGPIEQRRPGGWTPLPSLATWTQASGPDGTPGILNAWRFTDAPVTHGIRFDLNGTFRPLIRPSFGLPPPLTGFESGAVPALASGPVADRAVDGQLTLDVPGKQIPVRVVGTSRLFPTVVERPTSFVVVDYDTLFATLNADQPGLALPTEAWFFEPQAPAFASRLAKAPFRIERVVGLRPLEERLLGDPLAAGARSVLGLAALVGALLALAGLVLAVRSTLASERLLLAEYEALGVPPKSLRRAAQLRLVALSGLGIVAGVLGALVSLRVVGAFVAVAGTVGRPLPPIVAVVPWPAVTSVVAIVAAGSVAAAALLTRRALREAAARRLRG